MLRKNLIAACLLLATFSTFSQISFENPSFEGEPQDATVPASWIGCEPLTTPDILPGFWGVYTEPSDGETYLGIITREGGSFESFGQRLSEKLAPKICYVFSVDLAHSRTYAGYNGKIKLKIWGSGEKCGKDQLIYDSGVISNAEFKKHVVKFKAVKEMKYILFEASFDEKKSKRYNGNLLMDNLSIIKPCNKV